MKKIFFIYIFGTTLPIILFIIEKNIPFEILDGLTILANDIKISSNDDFFFYEILERNHTLNHQY